MEIPAGRAQSNEQELELLRRTQARDRDAFQELYKIYHRRLARFLTRMIRHYELAEEVINDTMWVVWQRAGDFRGSSQVSTWIMGIAYRRALKSLRRANLHLQPADDATEQDDSDAGMAIDHADRAQLVALALAQLPLEQRLVVEFTYFLGYSGADIAEIMECPINTVKTRMFHARRKLRLLLPELSGSEET
ncbi:MAG TPA: sigma-70 family RNA polymerase sigma factor [Rudaea sp.]|nr:sigma-70 family RNA polymerase sigma factor [Rudaea sp.]